MFRKQLSKYKNVAPKITKKEVNRTKLNEKKKTIHQENFLYFYSI